ncbi:MAG: hypothetical protein ACSLFM_13755 [Tepidiformaceae bacterium]|jgi:membrane protein implicated in regulation of membrane protease activity
MSDIPTTPRDAGTTGLVLMMAFMMICCVGLLLLFLAIPAFGWPVGLAIVAAGAVAMLFFHQRFMRH